MAAWEAADLASGMNEGQSMKRTRPTSPTLPDLDPEAARRLLLAALGGQAPEPETAPEPGQPERTEPPPESRRVPKLAFTIEEFCEAHGIGRSTFYRLRQMGQAPDVMEVGGTLRISAEAAKRWRRSRETNCSNGSEHG